MALPTCAWATPQRSPSCSSPSCSRSPSCRSTCSESGFTMHSSSVHTGSVERQRRRGDLLTYVVLIAGALLMLFPFFWMLVTSFKDMGEVRMWPPSLLPQNWDFTNYRDIWLQYPM